MAAIATIIYGVAKYMVSTEYRINTYPMRTANAARGIIRIDKYSLHLTMWVAFISHLVASHNNMKLGAPNAPPNNTPKNTHQINPPAYNIAW